jgi:hypothetical protein
MKVIGTDKNGDEIAEVSVTELDVMFKEIGVKVIDEFVAIMEEWNDNIKSIRNEDAFFTIENIRKVAEQMKGK